VTVSRNDSPKHESSCRLLGEQAGNNLLTSFHILHLLRFCRLCGKYQPTRIPAVSVDGTSVTPAELADTLSSYFQSISTSDNYDRSIILLMVQARESEFKLHQ
jgi:hypothetical protein